jgi:hypothetical protein
VTRRRDPPAARARSAGDARRPRQLGVGSASAATRALTPSRTGDARPAAASTWTSMCSPAVGGRWGARAVARVGGVAAARRRTTPANPALATPPAVNSDSATYCVVKSSLDRQTAARVELATLASPRSGPGFVSLARRRPVNARSPGYGAEIGTLERGGHTNVPFPGLLGSRANPRSAGPAGAPRERALRYSPAGTDAAPAGSAQLAGADSASAAGSAPFACAGSASRSRITGSASIASSRQRNT